jgi:hypothetical protein
MEKDRQDQKFQLDLGEESMPFNKAAQIIRIPRFSII